MIIGPTLLWFSAIYLAGMALTLALFRRAGVQPPVIPVACWPGLWLFIVIVLPIRVAPGIAKLWRETWHS